METYVVSPGAIKSTRRERLESTHSHQGRGRRLQDRGAGAERLWRQWLCVCVCGGGDREEVEAPGSGTGGCSVWTLRRAESDAEALTRALRSPMPSGLRIQKASRSESSPLKVPSVQRSESTGRRQAGPRGASPRPPRVFSATELLCHWEEVGGWHVAPTCTTVFLSNPALS